MAESGQSESANNFPLLEPTSTPEQIAESLQLSSDYVVKMFENEPGVLILETNRGKRTRRYRTIRIPRSVLERVLRRLANPPKLGRAS
jgi:hypothetical protein